MVAQISTDRFGGRFFFGGGYHIYIYIYIYADLYVCMCGSYGIYMSIARRYVIEVVDVHVYIYIYVYVYICVYTCMHACMHAYIHTCVCTYIYIYTHTQVLKEKKVGVSMHLVMHRQRYLTAA